MKKEIAATAIPENVIQMIGKDWFLASAGQQGDFNTMTCSWGGIGFLWNKPVAFVFVRPERYTHEFIERHDQLTLSFFSGAHREALTYLGTHSGRDGDKLAQTALTPYFTPSGNPSFEQATIVLEGRKLFKTHLKAEEFFDPSLLDMWYSEKKGNLHDVYVVELEHVWIEE